MVVSSFQRYVIIVSIASLPLLSACSRSCEDIQADIAEISREIQKNPDTAWDREKELRSLKNELTEKGCL